MNSLRDLADGSDGRGESNGAPTTAGRSASGAFDWARKLGWKAPLDWQLPYYYGLSLYLEGNYTEAEQSFLEILQWDTEHCASMYWLEKMYTDREDPRGAQYAALRQALRPEFPDLLQQFI